MRDHRSIIESARSTAATPLQALVEVRLHELEKSKVHFQTVIAKGKSQTDRILKGRRTYPETGGKIREWLGIEDAAFWHCVWRPDGDHARACTWDEYDELSASLEQSEAPEFAHDSKQSTGPSSQIIDREITTLDFRPIESKHVFTTRNRWTFSVIALLLLALTPLMWTSSQNSQDLKADYQSRQDRHNSATHGKFYDSCPVRFGDDQALQINCGEIGVYETSTNIHDGWNGKSTIVHVPPGADVRGLYQHYGGPTFGTLMEEGFFQLKQGYNRLHLDKYSLYADENLSDYKSTTDPGAVNDRLQAIFIADLPVGEIVIWEHDDPGHDEKLHIRRIK